MVMAATKPTLQHVLSVSLFLNIEQHEAETGEAVEGFPLKCSILLVSFVNGDGVCDS